MPGPLDPSVWGVRAPLPPAAPHYPPESLFLLRVRASRSKLMLNAGSVGMQEHADVRDLP